MPWPRCPWRDAVNGGLLKLARGISPDFTVLANRPMVPGSSSPLGAGAASIPLREHRLPRVPTAAGPSAPAAPAAWPAGGAVRCGAAALYRRAVTRTAISVTTTATSPTRATPRTAKRGSPASPGRRRVRAHVTAPGRRRGGVDGEDDRGRREDRSRGEERHGRERRGRPATPRIRNNGAVPGAIRPAAPVRSRISRACPPRGPTPCRREALPARRQVRPRRPQGARALPRRGRASPRRAPAWKRRAGDRCQR